MTASQNLRVEFQITFEDFREANRAHNRKTLVRLVVLVAICAVLLVSSVLRTAHRTATSAEEIESTRASAMVLLPWLALFGVIWIATFRFLGGGLQKLWDGQAQTMLPRAIEVSPDRIYLVDALVRTERLWGAFSKYRETRNLFLLYTSAAAFEIVPKRSFANAEQLNWFRDTLRTHVSPLAAQ